ncbi:MAG TPA: class I SAM-dependent methyltransferase [Alphaproteobacteria bacterium]|nr:class I SAM-dependent methyltransferase [Alphaproteobacteria bacterium]
MLKKLLFSSFLVSVSLFAHSSLLNAMEEKPGQSKSTSRLNSIDPERITGRPVQTQNGKGMQYPSLGSFEEEFLKDCRGVELSENPGTGNILFIGEAYGRLPMRVVRETPFFSSANIFVNELSADNLRHLISKVVEMKKSSEISNVWAASRMNFIVGDCLDLPENKKFTGLFRNGATDNLFDLVMCSNVIHFFDGEQVLKFFINTFNFLKPNGKAYIFTQSGAQDFSYDEMSRRRQMSDIYIKTCFGVMDSAQQDSSLLFPGLINDEWLLKTPVLQHILQVKPNGLGLNNFIPGRTLERIADTLGFEVVSQQFYSPEMDARTGIISMNEDNKGAHIGIILKKPKGYTGGPVAMETLDPTFVESCLTAKDKMKTFIDTKLDFPAGYPFVEKKKVEKKNK